ncbi:DUF7224 domain-containing protein [Marmoricola sp. RAF53]|uniref:DUF7224 domain-containing protein n=1 Tax=Marmoricola sp. RAF53 TaxID=3233059 RepID=UPI003F957801
MSPWTVLRVSGALWVVPATFALAVWVGMSQGAGNLTGYPVSDLATVSSQLILTGPFVAAYAALRLPPFLAQLRVSRPVRRRGVVLALPWSAVLLGVPAAGVAAMVSAARTVPLDLVAWEVVGLTFVTGIGCACFGALLGSILPRVLAVPLAGAGIFVWIAFPGSWWVALPRNLNADLAVCCADQQRPATALLLGSTVLALVVLAGFVVLVGTARCDGWPWIVRASGVLIVLATAGGLGAAAAIAAPGSLNMLAVEARTTPAECVSQHGLRVCVWPENRGQQGRSLRVLGDVDRRLRAVGLPGVTSISEDQRDSAAVHATATGQASESEIRYSIAVGYVQRASTCGGRDKVRDLPVPTTLVALASGVTPAELTEIGALPQTLSGAMQVLDAGPDATRQWFGTQTCGSTR